MQFPANYTFPNHWQLDTTNSVKHDDDDTNSSVSRKKIDTKNSFSVCILFYPLVMRNNTCASCWFAVPENILRRLSDRMSDCNNTSCKPGDSNMRSIFRFFMAGTTRLPFQETDEFVTADFCIHIRHSHTT
jgi:hypothetical protein